ncbi:YbhB/YbcL family Raf kinase inhibitor-like protein [soil metagenome]|jgi:Raf kinase inhibitor-like YbhB/YbcL family protein
MRRGVVAAAVATLGLAAGCTSHHATAAAAAQKGPLILSSPAFAAGARMPITYGCTGANNPPPLTWQGATPAGTAAWAIVLQDLDVNPKPWVQWVVSDIPVSSRVLPSTSLPAGALVSAASNGTVGYVGACPPSGAVHRYRFTIYALKAKLGLPPAARPATAVPAITADSLSSASVTGTFAR